MKRTMPMIKFFKIRKLKPPFLYIVFFSALALQSLGSDSTHTRGDFFLSIDEVKFTIMDSLWAVEQFSSQQIITDTSILNTQGYSKDSIPNFSKEVIQDRLKALDDQTPFSLVYNEAVNAYIDLYANSYRKHVSTMLGKANYYFPLFEEMLDKYDLPLEFKYLAIVESALKPHARSRSAATGLWQFMYATGKAYGLNVSSYVDDRSDPIKSTIAACEYFAFLYKMFNDWELVLAAYDGGPGYVTRALRKSGAKDYWSVRPYLRKETQNYVPKFIAVNYVMNYASEHNLYPIPYPYIPSLVDTCSLSASISFEVLSSVLDVDIEIVRELNPTYKRDLVPVSKSSKALICLPNSAIIDFINNEDSIYAYSKSLQDPYIEIDSPIVHRVKQGEYLGKIANSYNTTVGRIKNWNNLKSDRLIIGQKLVIYINPDRAPNQTKAIKNSDGTFTYTIQSGDTLWEIAQRHNGISVEQIEKLNNISANDLKPGLKIKIPKIG